MEKGEVDADSTNLKNPNSDSYRRNTRYPIEIHSVNTNAKAVVQPPRGNKQEHSSPGSPSKTHSAPALRGWEETSEKNPNFDSENQNRNRTATTTIRSPKKITNHRDYQSTTTTTSTNANIKVGNENNRSIMLRQRHRENEPGREQVILRISADDVSKEEDRPEVLFDHNKLRAHHGGKPRDRTITEMAIRKRRGTKVLDLTKNSNKRECIIIDSQPPSKRPKTSHEKSYKCSSILESWKIKPQEIQLYEQIGHGSFGIVRRGSWKEVDVAVKILHEQTKTDDFKREAAILWHAVIYNAVLTQISKLRHPNIVSCYGVITSPSICIVMELLEMSLHSFIHREHSQIHRIALGIAVGLHFLHQSKPMILHRDLKPGNILLDAMLNPRIADFGISRENTQGTNLMSRVGTLVFCAPEIHNNQKYNEKVDIYSYGMLLYVVVSRQNPWKDENFSDIQICFKLVMGRERPPIPHCTNSEISQIIRRCWQHEASNRPTASEIVKLLKIKKPVSMASLLPPIPPNLTPTEVIAPEVISIEDTDDEGREEKRHSFGGIKNAEEMAGYARSAETKSRVGQEGREGMGLVLKPEIGEVKREEIGDLSRDIISEVVKVEEWEWNEEKKNPSIIGEDAEEKRKERVKKVLEKGKRLVEMTKEDNFLSERWNNRNF